MLRLAQQPWATQVRTFEQLAIWDELVAMTSHRVTFEGASTELRNESLEVVDAFGRLLKRFPGTRVHVHAHTGAYAPPLYAPRFTRERAAEVAEMLVRHGIDRNRITAQGWGKAVAVAADWPPGRDSARGELFVEVDGDPLLLLPPLPHHYAGVAVDDPRSYPDHFEGVEGIDGSAFDDSDPAGAMPLLMQLMLQQGGLPESSDDDDDDDDDDVDDDDDEDENGNRGGEA